MKFLPVFTTLTALIAQGPSHPPPVNAVLHWNRVVTDALGAARTDPLTESRALAIVQLAVQGALDGVHGGGQASAVPAPSESEAIDAAIAAAAHGAMIGLLPGARTALDEALARALESIAEGDARARGIEVGRSAATAALASRARDGSDREVAVQPGARPGEYRPTPPDFTPAWMAQWGSVTPFCLDSSAQFRPPAPPAVDGPLARREVEELRRIGGQDGARRNDEQSEIARFWYENSPQGWNRIARTVAQSRQLDAPQSARLFALLNVAMADGFIAGFEAKYHHGYWRPATAVRAQGSGEWLSYLGTPPVPDYPSTHTVLGAAAATVLARFFGSDFVAFEVTSGEPYPGLTRSFWSFSEAARENGASRVLAGLHFPTAVRAGYQLGEDVGTWVFEHALLPRDEKATRAAASGAARR
ncbi:MAG TPA: vanadium-dependent haloperoxidase [Planctomycetota bacterium]